MDAIFNAIQAIVPHTARLSLYQVNAVTEGTDAQAEVSVRLEEGDKMVTARGADPDTLVASAKRTSRRSTSSPPSASACTHRRTALSRRREHRRRAGNRPAQGAAPAAAAGALAIPPARC